ncbi:hypothetical protein HanRHA438_Chr17g0835121 [Helianthus annuus]|uniref:Uncharacterized protein n=1 Tax=Helianthus annuus TaxID=4232 RepID=A0A9K3DL74_HELAN|nr:hypothetical protein HanXRQr2_Chr17g0825231 [Helianthus annuus]KAJ0828251.1 hypothetical protein HanRHA438_Chr17g0835121 [Helianthus annuus]
MFTNLTCKLSSVCVCEFWTECSQHSLSLGANGRTPELSTHAWVYIPSSAGLLEGFDRWSEGSSVDHMLHERSAWTSKDHPSRSNGRTMVEPYLSITSKDQVYPSRLSFDQNIFQLLSKSHRRMVDLVNLQYKSGHRLYQTEYRQSTDTSAPTNSPLAVALSLISKLCLVLLKV